MKIDIISKYNLIYSYKHFFKWSKLSIWYICKQQYINKLLKPDNRQNKLK